MHRAGLHLSIHAIGDKANHLLLDAYEQLIQINGQQDRRMRVEHAQHLRCRRLTPPPTNTHSLLTNHRHCLICCLIGRRTSCAWPRWA